MADPLDVTGQENVVPSDGNNLTSAIESAFDKTVTPDVPPATPVQESLPLGDDGRKRDAQGRFAPKEGSAPDAAAQPTGKPDAAAIPPAPGVAAPTPQFDAPPQSWKQEMRPLYEKVPPELRPYLHQREQELQHGFEAVAKRGNVAEAVLNEFVPYADQLQSEGATPITAMRTLLSTAHQLKTGGPEYRKAINLSLAQQYNVDLS